MSKNFQKQLQKKFEADRKRKLAKRSPSPSPAPEAKPQTQEQIRAQIAIRDGFETAGTVESFAVKPSKSKIILVTEDQLLSPIPEVRQEARRILSCNADILNASTVQDSGTDRPTQHREQSDVDAYSEDKSIPNI